MTYNIPKKDQDDVMSCFWIMMRECESKAIDDDDTILKVQVEGFARLWNRVTGSTFQTAWVK